MQAIGRREVVRRGFMATVALALTALFRREAAAKPVEAVIRITDASPGWGVNQWRPSSAPLAMVGETGPELIRAPLQSAVLPKSGIAFLNLADYGEEGLIADPFGRPIYLGPYAGWAWLDYETASITHAYDSESGEWSPNV